MTPSLPTTGEEKAPSLIYLLPAMVPVAASTALLASLLRPPCPTMLLIGDPPALLPATRQCPPRTPRGRLGGVARLLAMVRPRVLRTPRKTGTLAASSAPPRLSLRGASAQEAGSVASGGARWLPLRQVQWQTKETGGGHAPFQGTLRRVCRKCIHGVTETNDSRILSKQLDPANAADGQAQARASPSLIFHLCCPLPSRLPQPFHRQLAS